MNLQNVEQARYYMIEQQIRPWDVSDAAVLELLSSVKREDFVPPAQKSLAFVDMAIALPGGQSMLPPRVQARLLQAVHQLNLNGSRHHLFFVLQAVARADFD